MSKEESIGAIFDKNEEIAKFEQWLENDREITGENGIDPSIKKACEATWIAAKIEAWLSPAIANKATEEVELPELPQEIEVGGEGWDFEDFKSQKTFSVDHMHEYARQAIAADRASRQVANKAEVEPIAHLRFWASQSWSGNGNHGVEHGEGLEVCQPGEVGDDGKPAFPVFATPPATTGARTAQVIDHNEWAHVAYAEDGKLHWMTGRKFDNCELYARYPSVGASTALRPTDDELWDATLRDRDAYHDWADKLADAIAKHFGVDIGEHSNQNLPWAEALEAIENAEPVGASTVLTDEQLRDTEGYKLGWMEGMSEGAELATGGEKTAADVEAEFADLLPGSYYMDPPDGGSPSVLEQISRMAEDAAKWREVAAQAGQVAVPEDVARDAERYRWLRNNSNDAFDVSESVQLVVINRRKTEPPKRWSDSPKAPFRIAIRAAIDEAVDQAIAAAPSPAKESK